MLTCILESRAEAQTLPGEKPRDLRIDTYLTKKLRNKDAGARWADFAWLVMLSLSEYQTP